MLKWSTISNACENSSHKIKINIIVQSPALFLYITVSEKVSRYTVSKNGFIQITASEHIEISFTNPNCSIDIDPAVDVRIITVNDFMK